MTPQQQLNAFLTHCSTLRQGYFYNFKKKTSSMRHFVTALEQQIAQNNVKGFQQEKYDGALATLKLQSPKDHLKYLDSIFSLTIVWGTQKNYVALASAPLPVSTLFWNQVTGALATTALPISISSRYPGYHEAVATHLTALAGTTPGGLMLAALAAHPTYTTSIVDHPLSNQCGSNGSPHGMNPVARELYSDIVSSLGAETKAALLRAPLMVGMTRAAWLADKINKTPKYHLKGVPPIAASNMGVTEGMVQAWVGGQSIWTDFGNDPDLEQIKNAIIVALYPYSGTGNGCSSMVNYSLGSANPLNVERPPAIGLAHELVHAYFNMKGKQPGYEVENSTTVLFEYRCVGLGPWHGKSICENAIRTDWNSALAGFDGDDTRNLVNVATRDFYSKA
ncbi:type III secretion system effector protein [Granulicella arctica]|uniref:type III secretion system effector protein n=1 Tax=Granulicella arctica TaxID=940613 RepID=UPI0021E0593E|nr:type III secretion system effector protein [Granulicella arctica]